MAWMETHYYSTTLKNNIILNVLVPTPTSNETAIGQNHAEKYNYEKGLPVLYLLHGAYGDAFSWLRFSNIERYAQEKGIVVVMASAENSFYQDMKSGKQYETFFSKELPTFIQSIFPVSKRREDTYIAGFSMGGYGAWFLALSHPDLYAKAASISGAVDVVGIFDVKTLQNDEVNYMENVFGDLSRLKNSKYDLLNLCDTCIADGLIPALYQTIGTEDFFYQGNQYIREELQKRNIVLTYDEGYGGHDWTFWEGNLEKVLDWLLI